MDFSHITVNELLKAEISSFDSNLDLCRNGVLDKNTSRERFHHLQNQLYEIVDRMGEESAKAQGLHGPITTSRKLKMSDHRLYIMKDSSSNSGKGSILGFIKVGRKKLFVYDNTKVQHEIQTLCVLDFYVHESRQRMGCGRKLFDFMLGKENILVQHLAIDRPSSKLLSFMGKHYNLHVIIPQMYNFVIFEGFFNSRSGQRYQNLYHLDRDNNKNVQNNWMMPNSLRHPDGFMGASNKMYSRHLVTADNYHNRPTSSRNCYLQEPRAVNSAHHSQLKRNSPTNTFYKSGMIKTPKSLDHEFMTSKELNNNSVLHNEPTSNNQFVSYTKSSVGSHSNNRVSSPVIINVNYPPHNLTVMPSFQQPDLLTNQQLVQKPTSVLSVDMPYKSSSEIQDFLHRKKELNSPLVQQDGYLSIDNDMLNPNLNHQQIYGHQIVPPGVHTVSSFSPQTTQMIDHRNLSPYNQKSNTSSWTVVGVLREQNLDAVMLPGHKNKNSLW